MTIEYEYLSDDEQVEIYENALRRLEQQHAQISANNLVTGTDSEVTSAEETRIEERIVLLRDKRDALKTPTN